MRLLDALRLAFRRHDGDAAGVEQKRGAWRSIAERHRLVFVAGPHRGFFQGDRIEGEIGGRRVRIQSDADYDLQKLVVTIAIECDATPRGLWKHTLVDWYEARSVSAIDVELRPWLIGQRAGVGAFFDDELTYRQLYDIDERTLEFLLVRLIAWARQLELVRDPPS